MKTVRLKNLMQAIRRLSNRFRHRALILVYHRIEDPQIDPWSMSVKPSHFSEQLEILSRHFRPITLQQLVQAFLVEGVLPGRSVVITFDDGYKDNLTNARPLLERFDCPATMFLTTGFLGHERGFWWDELGQVLLWPGHLPGELTLKVNGSAKAWDLGEDAFYGEDAFQRFSHWRAGQEPPTLRHALYLSLWRLLQPLPPGKQRDLMDQIVTWAGIERADISVCNLLSPEEVVVLSHGGLVEIGAHTVNHPSLASLPPAVQQEEIRQSKMRLENIINRPVKSFAYPFGKRQDYANETVSLVRETGYLAACANISGCVRRSSDCYELPRAHAPDLDGDQFASWLSRKFSQ